MHWIPIAAWIAAAAIAVVVLGFCAYEIAWKSKRLRSDVAELMTLTAGLTDLQGSIAVARQRIAAASAELR
ncbi:hypothetical protein [Jatrophihabitans endophyticus]|uniref:hypothetical protein n=1 Tax=Jatrophihabitans endophyticus TaxID=1206085 RepID=UPI0019EDC936|nr:hypothetical protein [Jatrophihabitans endophyticus]MBE7190287.1 hypothetical protein [Jatrophihabitans endophyticus]